MFQAFVKYCYYLSVIEYFVETNYEVLMSYPVLQTQEPCFLWKDHFLFFEQSSVDSSESELPIQGYWLSHHEKPDKTNAVVCLSLDHFSLTIFHFQARNFSFPALWQLLFSYSVDLLQLQVSFQVI